jgi:M6 family metalloprotease-like protein
LFDVLVLALLFLPGISAFAMPAAPAAYVVHQPDGTPVGLRLRGDEWFHYEQDLRGFTVIRDRGWFVYGRRDQATGRLVSSGVRAGIDNPVARGLRPGELPSQAARRAKARAMGHPLAVAGTSGSTGTAAPASAPAGTGVLKNLVVLIRWADHTSRSLPSQSDVDVLMNAPGGDPLLAPTGSVRDVYLENSYGALSLQSTVAVWVTSNETEAYYAGGNSGLSSLIHGALRDALTKVDAVVNFADFDQDNDGRIDSITFLHSGYGAEWGGTDQYGTHYTSRIWSHKWTIFGGWTSAEGITVDDYHISPAVWGTSGSTIGRIGVIAHETGHFLGLPDLYDTDGTGKGIGSFGLMANSWGFDGSQKYPPHMCPWSKMQMGWLSPTVIDSAGTYALNAAELAAEAYRIDLGYPSGEYLLVENREPLGFDGAMPQGGLVIWHIDEAAGYNTEGYPTSTGWYGSHYKVAVLQADSNYDLEQNRNRGDSGDTWHAAGANELGVSTAPNSGPYPNTDAYQGNVFVQTDNRIFNISAAGNTMTFDFEVIGSPTQPPAAPTGLRVTALSHDTITLAWQDNSNDESTFQLERAPDGSAWNPIASVPANVTGYSDTGLPPSTTYGYRVRAANIAGNSAYSDPVTATTEPPPPPPLAPSDLLATAVSDDAISLTWTDNSGDEEAFIVRRSTDGVHWVEVATLAANSSGHQDNGLNAATTYFYQVFAGNSWGQSGSNTAEATTDSAPAYADAFAGSGILVTGSVQGSVADTYALDGQAQTITESESGGKPSRRRSSAEYQWLFNNVRDGLAITLFVNGWAPANAEADDFIFEVSLDNGSTWTEVLTIPNGSEPGTLHAAPLPSGSSGNLILRVVDTDQTQGARSLDSVQVDQLFLRTDLDPNDTEPVAPSNLTALAVSSSEVQLTWQDNSDNERGFQIHRSRDGLHFSEIASGPVDATDFLDQTGSPNQTYYYKVVAFTASHTATSETAGPVTTPDGIALQATGSKERGKAVVDLAWQGGSSVNQLVVRRSVDNSPWEEVDHVDNHAGGTYTDDTGLKPGSSIKYELRDQADTVHSNIATVVF